MTEPDVTSPALASPTAIPPPLGRERGWRDGRLLDLELRLEEGRERERRLAQLAWKPKMDERPEDDDVALHQLVLEARIAELQTYVKAVETSTPWRLIQWLRGLVGRAW